MILTFILLLSIGLLNGTVIHILRSRHADVAIGAPPDVPVSQQQRIADRREPVGWVA